MTEEQLLRDKLRRIEALFSGATTAGERDAAQAALDRIRAKLAETEKVDPPVEFKFSLQNTWSRRLFAALCRRYGLKPYRYRGQRHTTLNLRVPKSFVHQTLWPQFQEYDQALLEYLDHATERIIQEEVNKDTSEAVERLELE